MDKIMRKKPKITTAASASSGSKSLDEITRKPLTELSNLNLIPADILRRLCSNSISTLDAQSLLWKSQTPIIQFHPNPNSSRSDSRSITSIGSSNFNTIANYNAHQNPTRQLPHSSSASSGEQDCEVVPNDVRQGIVSLEKQGKINVSTVSSNPVAKTIDKGKSVSMPLGTTRASQAKNKQKAFVVSPYSAPIEKAIVDGKPIFSPVSVTPVQKLNDKAGVVAALPKVNPSEEAKDKGKETIVSFGSSSYDKTKDKGKAVAILWNSLYEQTEDKGESIRISCPQTKKPRESIVAPMGSTPRQIPHEKANATAALSSVNLSDRIKDKGKATVVSFGSSTFGKAKDKGKAVAMPWSSLSDQADDAGKSTSMLVRCPQPNKQMESCAVVVSASSCPPIRRKRNTRDDLYQADLTPSKAWTDPHLKQKKRRCTQRQTTSENSLPEEFVKQQKAYFQEVDDFELEVEEALNNDKD